MSSARPRAVETLSWTQSIARVLSLEQAACIIICCSREDLLQRLVKEVNTQSLVAGSQEDQCGLLHATIGQVSVSRNIQIVYTSSLMHLRAGITTLTLAKDTSKMIYILGLPDLHLFTNELSAQNLSRSLALVIEVAALKGLQVEFLCPRLTSDHWEEDDMLQRQTCIWEKRLPVLSASVKGAEDRVWSGRTVMMGNVFGQWCDVIKAGG